MVGIERPIFDNVKIRLRNILSSQPFFPYEVSCADFLKSKNRNELRFIDGKWIGPDCAHWSEELQMDFPTDITEIDERGKRFWDNEKLEKYKVKSLFGEQYRTNAYYVWRKRQAPRSFD